MSRTNHTLTRPWIGLLCAVCTPLSIASAQENAVEYSTTSLSPTVSMITGRGGNVGVSAGAEGVYLIDDQFENISAELLQQVRAISDGPIRYIINTHYHGDHVGANAALNATGAVIVAHDNVRQRMSTDQFSQFWNNTTEAWPLSALPTVTFSDTLTLHLNGESANVHHIPHGHTDGDVLVHFPVSNVIHMGDLYFNGLYPFIDLDGGGSVQGMLAGVERALELANEDTRIIPGHGPVSNPAELAKYRDFLIAARDRVQSLIDQGKTLEQAIAAQPTAEWDDTLGAVWITPAQLVTFIYNSLKGLHQFTRIPANSGD